MIPKISIIVPVYKVEKYLRRCLDSIVAQTFTDWECILIDDGSPDNSGKICDEYAEKNARFRVIHQENAGVSAARNAGLDVAKGEWIGFVDSDDWICETYLNILYKNAIENNADMVIAGCIRTDGKKEFGKYVPVNGWLNIPKDFAMNMQSPWGKLFKREICEENKFRFPINISVQEDLYFNFLFLITTKKIYGIADTPYYYFGHDESTLSHFTKQKIQDEITVQTMIELKLIEMNAGEEWYEDFLLERKVYIKNELLFNFPKPDIDGWWNCFPELSEYAIKYTKSKKRKIIVYLVYNHYYALVKLFFAIWHKIKSK